MAANDEDWRCLLSPDEFNVAREGGTERAFSGRYWNEKRTGVYYCVCCRTQLFASNTKYDSGSGWPSFFQPVKEGLISEVKDISHGIIRIEIRCSTCSSHLGHRFPDGPPPTHTRYCVNSLSLEFVLDGDVLPERAAKPTA